MIKAVLFDLDGTLLPMEQDGFAKCYFKSLAAFLAPHGYEPAKLIAGINAGVEAMVRNDGSMLNEDVFWQAFADSYGEEATKDKDVFDNYYRTDFVKAKDFCKYNPAAAKAVNEILNKGYRVALATNPVFPKIATEARIFWAGLEPDNFEIITTYENSYFCKPNPKYYSSVAEKMGVKPEECLMVGNDAVEDVAALKSGMKVFLITDCLIDRGIDISNYPHGNFDDLIKFIAE